MQAYTGEDRDARTTFFVLGNADGAKNTISSFHFVDDVADKSLADVVDIDVATNVVSSVRINGNDVIIDVTNRRGTATERAVVQNAVGKNMLVTESVTAQVDNTDLIYDGEANFFVAKGKNASISVDSTSATTAEIWLDGKANNGLGDNFVGDIAYVNASKFDGKAELVGATNTNNTLIGGAGKNSLWGGNGSEGNDLLFGGAGQNSFFYANGNGDDSISGTSEGDLVYLSEVTLDNIASTAVENGVATINFKDGGKLTVNDAGNCSYILTQGDQAQIYQISDNQFVGKE